MWRTEKVNRSKTSMIVQDIRKKWSAVYKILSILSLVRFEKDEKLCVKIKESFSL